MKVYKIAGSTKLYQVFPVGAVYISVVNTNPHYLFGGTWTQITDRFLYCTTTSKTTGGEANHTLTIDEMPSHNHNIKRGTAMGSYFGFTSLEPQNPPYVGSTESAGGGQPHNNMPPYFTVYAWYRTA
jgi:microcystin-dependent protein